MAKPPQNWLEFTDQKKVALQSGRPKLLTNVDHFKELAKGDKIEAVFEEVLKISVKLEKKCKNYVSNGFQTYVVAHALNDKNHINVNILPPGSGKGWMAVLLSSVLAARGKECPIVTSDTYLVKQLEDMLG